MPSTAASPLQSRLAVLWQRTQPKVLERLDELDAACVSAHAGTLTPLQHAEALATAHKLAGSLGMFGFPEGSRLAQALEQHLELPTPTPATLLHLTEALRRTLFPEQR